MSTLNKIEYLLKQECFELQKSKELYYTISSFKKIEGHRILRVGYVMNLEDTEYFFSGFTVSINFMLLESIIIPIISKNSLIGEKSSAEQVYNSFYVDYGFDVPIVDKKLCKTDKDYLEVEEIFFDLYLSSIKPFFAKWNSLYTLYEFIKDKTEVEELESILGIFWQFKKAAILRLCNDENYQEYMDNLYDREKKYFEEDPNDIDNIRYYNAAKELKEVLDKTEPVYNV